MTLPSLVFIPAGEFLMGAVPEDKFATDTERPRCLTSVDAFHMARSPVTLGHYREFRPGHEDGLPDEWPAACVSWHDAVAYCEWLGSGWRLPSESEWEYAARAGSESLFPWGDSISPDKANYLFDESGRKIGPGRRTPPGQYPPNTNGLWDMIGNVCEWVQDCWRGSLQSVVIDGECRRVLRGGAWDYMPRLLRTSWRDGLDAMTRRDNVGFRPARSA